ncbi:MAG: hypothetical protein ACI8QF_002573 [Limisphaerales bacterium]|jgi:hypothetical protein
MKVKDLLALLGFRGKAKRFGYRVKDFDAGEGMTVRYAQWLHPSETEKQIDP